MNSDIFYNYDKLFSFPFLIGIVIGERGCGKSFNAKVSVLKRFLKTGEQFIYLRRYKTELDTAPATFWSDIQNNGYFEDENIKVTAFHNHHLQDDEGEAWLSYSYLIETDNKIIVFSGDIRDMYDLDTALKNGCDLLLLETGHHKLLDISDYIRTQSIGEIIFVHHGREIINNRNSAELMLKDFTCHASISYDGMIKEL